MRHHGRGKEHDGPNQPETYSAEIEPIEEAEERKKEHHETRYS